MASHDETDPTSPGPTERSDREADAGGMPEETESLRASLEPLDRDFRRLSAWRLATFAAGVVGLGGWGTSPLLPLAVSLPAFLAFALVWWRHEGVRSRRRTLRDELLLAEEARERRRDRRRQRPLPPAAPPASGPLGRGERVFAPEPEGLELDPGTADDLALLAGPRSLFGVLDASSTSLGARRLVHLLTHPLARAADLRERQRAVAELASRPGGTRAVARALLALRHRPIEPAIESLSAPALFASQGWLALLAHVSGTLAPLSLLAGFVRLDLLAPFFFLVLLHLALIGWRVRDANPARARLVAFGPLLDALGRLERALDGLELTAGPWGELREVLAAERPARERLRRRVRLLELHELGILFEIWNVVTLWELRLLPGAERILQAGRDDLERALGALGEAEALASFASALVEQPGTTLPEPLEEEAPRFEALDLVHPLLDPDHVVANDAVLGGDTRIVILTGSNMAGKSTHLKAVGQNLALAAAGGPVWARELRWTPLRLFTDVNVRDSLDDGKSYFQIEVERVLRVVEAARSTPFVLAIFDELFRGTNSAERLAISRSILRDLRDRGALVLLATHDLALTRLVTRDREPAMANRHLRESIEGSEMRFDYRVREGPARTRNAIRVLEVSGYPEDVIREAREACGPEGEG